MKSVKGFDRISRRSALKKRFSPLPKPFRWAFFVLFIAIAVSGLALGYFNLSERTPVIMKMTNQYDATNAIMTAKSFAPEQPTLIETETNEDFKADTTETTKNHPKLPDHAEVGYIAIMVENMVDSWPLSGLAEAVLVIEAPVEGNVTRFMAVYPPGSEVPRIGPVRSARPYFLDWAQELDTLYVHAGGSPEALHDIEMNDLRNLNQIGSDKYFWRDPGRLRPHDVYTSTDLLYEASSKLFSNHQIRLPQPWSYKNEADTDERPQHTNDIVIDSNIPDYRVTWKYDSRNNDYVRWQGNTEQRDEDGSLIRAKNVVIQYCQIQTIDDIGRRRIETLGEGKALIALDGKIYDATWKKPQHLQRTRYYDSQNAEIEFNIGKTWVEIVSNDVVVTH